MTVDVTLPFELHEHVPLAPLTTLEVGGATRYLARCHDLVGLQAVLAWAGERQLPIFLLGGGSNVLVADGGFAGLTPQYADDSWQAELDGDAVVLRLGAGHDWDAAVARCVEQGWGGVECLSGIPGLVGAAPIQNIGAYGQDVSETLGGVEGIELSNGNVHHWSAAQCRFGYRSSAFKEDWRGRYILTAVTLRLPVSDHGYVRYGELQRRLEASGAPPTLSRVRREVLAIRGAKSMLRSDSDPNRRSAGSFFVNPVVPPEVAEQAAEVWRQRGDDGQMPAFPASDGRVKLSAAWLIERAGFPRGYQRGPAGLSSRHTLALINRGGAKASDLLDLAAEIRMGVQRVFGVTLVPEPQLVGFSESVDELFQP